MNYMLKNWKTTLAGVLALAGVVTTYWLPQFANEVAHVTGVLIGLGLIAAKDGNKTGV
jgi:hypothetical protein